VCPDQARVTQYHGEESQTMRFAPGSSGEHDLEASEPEIKITKEAAN
jgi:hypothetical protein